MRCQSGFFPLQLRAYQWKHITLEITHCLISFHRKWNLKEQAGDTKSSHPAEEETRVWEISFDYFLASLCLALSGVRRWIELWCRTPLAYHNGYKHLLGTWNWLWVLVPPSLSELCWGSYLNFLSLNLIHVWIGARRGLLETIIDD